MKKPVKRSLLAKKILKIKAAFEGLGIETDESLQEFLKLFEIRDLAKSLKTHAGIYAYVAIQNQAIQNDIEKMQAKIDGSEGIFGSMCDEVTSRIRESMSFSTEVKKKSLSIEQKKEIVSLIKLGSLLESSYYHDIDDEQLAARVKKSYEDARYVLTSTLETEQKLADLRATKGLIEQITNALAYQKNNALKCLTDLEVVGIRQEI